MGLTNKLRDSLEGYLAKSAAELDERGAELAQRANELEAEQDQLERTETEFEARARMLEELGPMPVKVTQALDRALDTLNERVIQIAKSDGSVIQQIVAREPGRLNRLMDLQVDAARNQIFLSNGDEILRAQLPEPPLPRGAQPEPAPSAEATAAPQP